MPTINNNEKRLLLVFGIVIFLAANVLGFFLINGMMKSLDSQKKKYNARLTELKEAQAQDAIATERADWMAQNFKGYPTEEYRETYLAGVVFGELKGELDVEISKDSVMPTDMSGDYVVRSRFRMNVKGPWTDIYKFIYRLQKPEEFRFVPRISMVPKKSEEDDSKQFVEVQVELEKWWPKPDTFIGDDTALAQNEQPEGGAVKTDGTGGTPPAAPAGTSADKTPDDGTPSPGVITPAPASTDSSTPAPPPAPAGDGAPANP